jgi:hypothetical protein
VLGGGLIKNYNFDLVLFPTIIVPLRRMTPFFTTITTLLLLPLGLLAQALTLKDLKIDPFFSCQEATTSLFTNQLANVELFSTSDISQGFATDDDWLFLQPIAKQKKVVLMGETHYSKEVHHLRNRAFFALNTFDYYPLLLTETAYSLAEFYNYYVHISSDAEASAFLDKELASLLYTEEDLELLNHMRAWNKAHPDKPLSIGGTDLEFAYEQVLDRIVKPYLNKVNGVSANTIDSVMSLGQKQRNEFFVLVKPILDQAKKQHTIGDYPFITARYITNVLTNFSSTNNAFRYSFDFYRQKAIVRNITSTAFYGDYIQKHKVMLHGGGEHMKTLFSYPDGGNFLSEGSYLNQDYALTKNKTYSIMVESMAYALGDMKNRKIKDCVPQGNQYNTTLDKLQRGFEQGIVSDSLPYYVYERRNELLKFLSRYYYQKQAVSIGLSDWKRVSSMPTAYDEATAAFMKAKADRFTNYDKYIIVPGSSLTRARLKPAQ